jgi:proline dehydrogenase
MESLLFSRRLCRGTAAERSLISWRGCMLQQRAQSTTTITTHSPDVLRKPAVGASQLPPLSIMPMRTLLKSYFITSILASPRIINICLPLMNKVANSESALLNPDRNPILHMLIRKLIYDHFMAGETPSQVRESVRNMKGLGLSGVILGYAKEVNITGGLTRHEISTSGGDVGEASIRIWKEGLLETLSLLGPGDFLSLK